MAAVDSTIREANLDNWVVKYRAPEGPGPHPVLLLIHGFTGDENVMWIFANRLPGGYFMIAPRGLFPSEQGGYSWQEERKGSWPTVADFQPALDALQDLLTRIQSAGLEGAGEADFSHLSLVGFSQGAALAYTLALKRPGPVQQIAGLAGFLPVDADRLAAGKPLLGVPVFAAHGTRDERVPVAMARRAVNVLEAAGAEVTYCEDEVGHKLSLTCFRAFEEFFK